MAGNPNELQYGERSQLQAVGQKELPVTGGMREARSAGRPASGTTPEAGGQPSAGIPQEHDDLMVDYMEAKKALDTARMYAQPANAGPWTKLVLMAAETEFRRAAQQLKSLTPDWELD